ncbi:hypothetical protein PK35_16790 [Tamlana nanhaiensis]|uniref:Uncharacterized protein n=1 Tax=Neotamlana nanhaiensis TaxID=1382798 RepID=A0A0D7VVY9_9FLAO|nr:hypothetical protein [Tamlana nanhaiensis]KJD31045.1 hypothetical protein PK35_16790 [Tamlana nanhaiensis]
MDKMHEQILIRAEIDALNLIEKHLNILKKQSDFSVVDDFDLAIFHAENEAERNIDFDIKFSAQNNVPSISSHTVQWFMENTRLDYNMYLKRKANINELRQKIELTKNEELLSDFYSGMAEFHLKNIKENN